MAEAPRRVVCDTGPLISLEKLADGYGFIRLLYDDLVVPPAVLEEVATGQFETNDAYLRHFGIEDLLVVVEPSTSSEEQSSTLIHLDEGERQAILLALELDLPLLIEEQAGREQARTLGLRFSGIAGQLLRAARTGVLSVDDAAAYLRRLREAGRINRQVQEAVTTALRDLESSS